MPDEKVPFPRRFPAIERKIAEIKPNDVRISILGTLIDKDENLIVIDDGSGKIKVVFDKPIDFTINQRVRVFGRVIPLEDGFEIQGEIIQDMSKLDINLYNEVKNLEEGVENV